MAMPRVSRLLSSFRPSSRSWVPIPLSPPTVNSLGQCTKVSLSLSTWNINAFSPRPTARASAIIDHLLKPDASDVIFLQEVNYNVYAHLLHDARIRAGFFITDAEDKTAFDDVSFTAITLLSKASFTSCNSPGKKILGPVTRYKFPSQYKRDAVGTDVFLPSSSCDGSWQRLRLINIHLDSLSSTLHYRKEQMAIVAGILRENVDQPGEGHRSLGLAAGDFNAIRPEDQDLIATNGLIDSWVQLHGNNATKHAGSTWGDAEDKRWGGLRPGRLDRVAMTEGLETITMEVLRPGTITVPKPGNEDSEIRWSDHAGLRCAFRICY